MNFKCRQNCGECCGPVPIPKSLWRRKKFKAQCKVEKVVPCGKFYVIPVTKDGWCVFLRWDKRCVIYVNRPWLYKKFGQDGSSKLLCPYLRQDGTKRNHAETILIKSYGESNVDRYINLICHTESADEIKEAQREEAYYLPRKSQI